MAKLERKNIKIFASKPNDATQVTSFLTAKDETPNVSLDPDVIQNSNYVKSNLRLFMLIKSPMQLIAVSKEEPP